MIPSLFTPRSQRFIKLKNLALSLALMHLAVGSISGCKDNDGDKTTAQLDKRAANTTSAGNENSQPLANDSLLNKLPSSTAAYSVINFSGEAYKRLIKSRYRGAPSAEQPLNVTIKRMERAGASAEVVEMVRQISEVSNKLGLTSADGAPTVDRVFSRMVIFAGLLDEAKTGGSGAERLPATGGVFIRAAQGVSLSEKLESLKSSLARDKIEITPERIAGSDNAISVATKGRSDVKLYLAASKDLLGITTGREPLETLFSNTQTETVKAIKASDEYRNATVQMKDAADELSFIFVSLKRLKPLLEILSKREGGAGEFDPETIPIEGVVLRSSFPKAYLHNLGISIVPKTPEQREFFTALSATSKTAGEGSSLPQAQAPKDAAFTLTVDTGFIGQLNSLMQSIKQSSPIDVNEHLSKIRTLTLGARSNTVGSPLPDIFLAINSSSRDQLNTFLETTIGMGMALTGQGANWQTKDVGGVKTRFITTLVGAGVYIAAPSGKDTAQQNTLLVGSSEGVIADLISNQEQRGSATNDPLSAGLLSAQLARLHLNFPQVRKMLDTTKDSLALVTGGSSELNEVLNATKIESWGEAAVGVSYLPGSLLIDAGIDG